ncbi:hypothetical protein SH1V18_08720 [Vallitalea longa]|uniref:Uncharacterized protein n=1 Tax=Vallitalea longa TaxID=2936439 RepID=A0A9W5Y7Z0_9FIRM|nr:hypothetical protein [Vallitalea longa]GKX28392.1 hypothetical protein SH1V18_08720 [Vallitalea longa]
MLKLIKYEFLRKIKNLGICIVIFAILEGISLYTIYKGSSSLPYTLIIMLLSIFGMFIFLLIDSITMYSSDLYKKSGYMLFLTPNSSSKIIGSKLLVSLIEATVGLSLLFGCLYINYQIVYDKYLNNPQAQELLDILKSIFSQPSTSEIVFIVLSFVISWFSFITTIYLAITIRKTLLANVKAGGLFSFIIFLVLQGIITYVQTLVTTYDSTSIMISNNNMAMQYSTSSIIYSCVVMLILYVTSSVLLSKGVDL